VPGGEGESGRAAAAPRRWGEGVAPERIGIAVAPHQEEKEPRTSGGRSTDHDVEPGEERDDENTCATGEATTSPERLHAGTPTTRLRQAGHDYTVDPS
jgi:hypothetical protein